MHVVCAVVAAALALVAWQAPQVARAENGSGGGMPQDVTWSFDPTVSTDLPDSVQDDTATWLMAQSLHRVTTVIMVIRR